MEHTTSATVTSADGTVITYERVGHGPALILIDAAGHYREFTSFTGLIDLLAPEVHRLPLRPPRTRLQHRYAAVRR